MALGGLKSHCLQGPSVPEVTDPRSAFRVALWPGHSPAHVQVLTDQGVGRRGPWPPVYPGWSLTLDPPISYQVSSRMS